MGNKIQTVEESKVDTRDERFWDTKQHNNKCHATGWWDCQICQTININTLECKGCNDGSSYMSMPIRWYCDACQQKNCGKQDECQNCHSIYLKVPVVIVRDINKTDHNYESFFIYTIYSDSVTVKALIQKAEQFINDLYPPKHYYISLIYDNSFIGKQIDELNSTQRFSNLWSVMNNPNDIKEIDDEWNNICSKSITEWDQTEIINKGFEAMMSIRVKHKTIDDTVSCHYLKEDAEALNCPIYKAMKLNYEFTENNLSHLYEFVHFKDESEQKPKCKYGLKCNAFSRLSDGENRVDDRCHIKIYSHPPREERQIQLESNMNEYICNTEPKGNTNYYIPTKEDKDIYKWNDWDGYINALMKEVIDNGFKSGLCLVCHDDNCKHNVYENNYNTLLSTVDDKLSHFKHQEMGNPLNRGEMLAIILYTGCDCNYDLCKAQRNGNYTKWKWFDYCLYNAIETLSNREIGCYKLYCGVSGVKLTKKKIILGWFPTYTSTSWDRNVALSFMDGEGMLIELDTEYRRNTDVLCCDVSWISKFPDEREVLIARSCALSENTFSLCILDENDGTCTQTVSLKYVGAEEEMKQYVNDALADGTFVVDEDGVMCVRVPNSDLSEIH